MLLSKRGNLIALRRFSCFANDMFDFVKHDIFASCENDRFDCVEYDMFCFAKRDKLVCCQYVEGMVFRIA